MVFVSAMKSAIFAFPEVLGVENLKNLKFFIFYFFDFVDRLYIITYGPDLLIARGPARRVRFANLILNLQVELVLSDFPLTVYRLKPAPK